MDSTLRYRFMYHRHNLTSLHYVLIHSRTPQKQSSEIALLSGLWNRTGNLYINARMKAPLENRGPGKTVESLYISENRQTQAGQENNRQDRPVTPYIFRLPLTVSRPEGHSEPFSEVGLGKTARGQRPNPHPRGHPSQSF